MVTRNGDLNREIQERNWYAQNDRDLKEARALEAYEIERQTPTRETPRNIWEAFQESIDPRDFKEALEKRGLHLARISEDDHRNSHTYRFVAERQGKFSPLLYYGEYVAVNEDGRAYRLNLGTTGMQPHRVKEFMKPLDSDQSIPALHEVRRELENTRESPDPRPTGKLGLPDRGRDVHPPRRLNRTAERAAGKMLELAASAVESFLAPVLTREQKIDGRVADNERQLAAEEAERLRRQNSRER